MPQCDCGAHVSSRYFRVFSIDGHLSRCLERVDSRDEFGGETR